MISLRDSQKDVSSKYALLSSKTPRALSRELGGNLNPANPANPLNPANPAKNSVSSNLLSEVLNRNSERLSKNASQNFAGLNYSSLPYEQAIRDSYKNLNGIKKRDQTPRSIPPSSNLPVRSGSQSFIRQSAEASKLSEYKERVLRDASRNEHFLRRVEKSFENQRRTAD